MADKFFSSRVSPWGLLSSAAAIACIGTAVGFWGRLWWPFELASHFRVQYFFFLMASTLLFLLGRKVRGAILTSIFALINLSVVVPLYLGGPSAHAGGRTYRAVLINVNSSNQAYGKVQKFIRSVKPDFMVLVEVNQAWMDELQITQLNYPFSRSLPHEDNRGIALFSRIPFENAEIRGIGEPDVPSVVARFKIDGEPLTVIGAHTYPPKGQAYSRYRNHQLTELAQVVSSQKGLVMVLGDLNTTSWSPFFRDLIRTTGLRDSRKGFGLQPSWPTGFPPLWISIDHCLVSSRVVVHNRQTGPTVGSDHYPIVVDFSVEPRQDIHVAVSPAYTAASL